MPKHIKHEVVVDGLSEALDSHPDADLHVFGVPRPLTPARNRFHVYYRPLVACTPGGNEAQVDATF